MSGHRELDKAFVGGLAWTIGAKLLTQFFAWGSIVVLARVLSQADFGIMEMAGVFVGLTNVLAEFGIGAAVTQMHELDQRVQMQLNTASLLLCTLAYGCIVVAAPAAAAFFRSEPLKLLVIINALSLVITGLQAVPNGLLQKAMDYRRLSIAEEVQGFLQATVAVVCALRGMGYWSLVWGALIGKFTSALLAFWWQPIGFAVPKWKEIKTPMLYGWHLAVGRLAWAAYNQSDSIVVGRTLGDAALGSYRFALNLASAPAEKIGMLIMRVTGPLFARVQKDEEAVRRYFKVFSEALSMSILPLMFGMMVVAPEAIKVLLGGGNKWDGAIAPLRWLAIFIGARTLSALASQVLGSLRYQRFNMWLSLVSFVIMPVGFFVASRWGAGAIAATWVILSPVTVLLPTIKLLKVIRLEFREYLAVLTPSLVGSAGMLAAVLAVRFWLRGSDLRPIISLGILTSVGGVVYAGILLTFYRERVTRYVHFLKGLRKGNADLVTETA